MIAAPSLDRGRVVGEEVAITCASPQPEVTRCELEARYDLEGDPRVAAVASRRAQVSIDGDAVAGASPRLERLYPGLSVTAVAPAEGTLVVRATLSPEPTEVPRFWSAAPLVRHPMVSEATGLHDCAFESGCSFYLDYVPAEPPRALRLRIEPGRGVSMSLREADFEVESQPVDAVEPGRGDRIVVELATAPREIAPGGPFAAVGAALHPELAFRWRAGWEMFAPDFIAHALAIEGDHRGEVLLVPSSEVVTSSVLLLPSFGIGVGLPIVIQPAVEAGIRGQISLAFPWISVVGTLDLLPSRAAFARPSLFVQVGF